MDGGSPALSWSVTGGVIALVAVLVVATAAGLLLRRRAGRFRPGPGEAGGKPASAQDEALTEADLGSTLGDRATLVQFSTAFCAPCRPTRQILGEVAGMVEGVTHVDIDAAERLDLVRRLRINSAPTILVLDPGGAIVKRAVGLPRKADVIAALGSVVTSGPPSADSEIRADRGSDSRAEPRITSDS
jgi:thiol-disulfide isomerase/thioredoxin